MCFFRAVDVGVCDGVWCGLRGLGGGACLVDALPMRGSCGHRPGQLSFAGAFAGGGYGPACGAGGGGLSGSHVDLRGSGPTVHAIWGMA